jgi:hypothetical protein
MLTVCSGGRARCLVALRVLRAEQCGLTALPLEALADMPSLQELHISSNPFVDLTVSHTRTV